ncbi:DUF58 domain-containing protein [Marinobacter sp. chi1]|uniref:DUF58 domain-containing protein n=1 Tax=Marinobacter suaedae TaxID=3057675 RepID=A0ABT8W291_9GAMM|nr:DUF58 domain-containing protein [Marinobacter sp. chi1]MDO3722349.1 DUF58 domain-containing protein [Marinobacter sp. chi1]
MGHFFTDRWQRWIHRRIPRSDVQHFDQKNIFILPTRAGFVFGLLLVIMLITGINYQNSLIYLMTFVLGTVFIGAMHQTHRNLSGLELSLLKAGEAFSGEEIGFRFRAKASGADVVAIWLSWRGHKVAPVHIPAGQTRDVNLLIPTTYRGYFRPERIRVETRFPFGLLRAWSWIRPATSGVIYPSPLAAPESAGAVPDECDDASASPIDDTDHAELRPWREGDLSQRVMWKRYARNRQMVVADWEGEGGSPHWLDFDSFQGIDPEVRLRYLAWLVRERTKADQPFGLLLPGVTIEPVQGTAHGQRCLRALAVWGLEGTDVPDGEAINPLGVPRASSRSEARS